MIAPAFFFLLGKSGLHMAAQGLTALRSDPRNSGTERMSGAVRFRPGTGGLNGAAGVKTAKLCVEQDQIGKVRIKPRRSQR